VIILKKIAYGPNGFTCLCGGTRFKKERKKTMISGISIIRSSRRCKKCQASYIFVPRMFAKEAIP
jgi:hypothetical protein